MTEIRFYHLRKQTPLQALVSLVERAMQKKEPILIHAQNKQDMDAINTHLWTYQPESFLPHDTEDNPNAETQLVLISSSNDNKNKATMMFQMHDGEMNPPASVTLCCKIFDGGNETQLTAARAEWKRLKDLGHTLTYWQQDEQGKWEQKA